MAPKSIIAWAKPPGRSSGVSVSANALMSVLAAGNGVVTAKSRATTRSILPSTGVARLPKAMTRMPAEIMARASIPPGLGASPATSQARSATTGGATPRATG